MPVFKLFGIRPVTLNQGLVWTPPAAKTASPPIQIDRWFRNGRAPDAVAMSSMNEAMTQALLYRTKEVFGAASILGTASGIGMASFGVGSRARFRFAFYTSPHSHALLCRVVMYPQTAGFNYDAYGRLRIFTSTNETAPVVEQEFHYGTNPLNTNQVSGWPYLKVVDKFITGLSPDTDYYGCFYDVDYGLIQSASIIDLQSLYDNNGYLPQNFTSESKILDVTRENIASLIPSMWKRGGAKVLNWTVENGTSPITRTSSTPINIIDNSSTAISASTPGYTLDMTGKARLSQSTGVPVVMKVFGSWTKGASANSAGGSVYLKNSAGTTIASVTNAWSSSTPSWVSTAFTLPASVDKYDLHFASDSGGGTTAIYAISIYEHET